MLTAKKAKKLSESGSDQLLELLRVLDFIKNSANGGSRQVKYSQHISVLAPLQDGLENLGYNVQLVTASDHQYLEINW